MVSLGDGVLSVMLRRNAQSRLPTMPRKSVPVFRSPEKHSENPNTHQSTVVQPIETKLWIMMASTFFRPTRPP